MNEDEQRIAIAEFCGRSDVYDFGLGCDKHGRSGLWGTDPASKVSRPVPDYLHDLNAMHEAEKQLSVGASCKYWTYLQMAKCSEKSNGHWRDLEAVGHATAAQRAEALLRTIGKWKETK